MSPLSDNQKFSFITTWLPGKSPNVTIYLYVRVTDAFLAQTLVFTNATILSPVQSVADSINKISNILSSLTTSDLHENIKILGLISKESLNMENGASQKGEACPTCSGHGTCLAEKCVCDEGWTMEDCSMPQSEFDGIIETKLEIIDKLRDSYNNMQTEEVKNFILQSLVDLTSGPRFNTDSTMTQIQEMLEKDLNIKGEGTILNEEDQKLVADL